MTDKQIEDIQNFIFDANPKNPKIVELVRFPVFIQDINETNENYKKRIREYMEQ